MDVYISDLVKHGAYLHRNHEAYEGRGERGGKGVWRWGKRENRFDLAVRR